jgi:hypothetical protein
MEDFGYTVERIILGATDLGLGTCWLGGTFSKSSFSKKISLQTGETIPAVIAIGYAADKRRYFDSFVRRRAGSDHRLPWQELFFNSDFGNPLSQAEAGDFSPFLEAVRLAPSASNNQPWRIVKDGSLWHFYLHRTKGYGERNQKLFKLVDLQRVDMGIAMCHFDLTAREAGFRGQWVFSDPMIELRSPLREYIVSWEPISS